MRRTQIRRTPRPVPENRAKKIVENISIGFGTILVICSIGVGGFAFTRYIGLLNVNWFDVFLKINLGIMGVCLVIVGLGMLYGIGHNVRNFIGALRRND